MFPRISKRFIALVAAMMLLIAAIACDDGPGYETFPVANRGITCITTRGNTLIAPIEVGGFMEDSQNYDLLISEDGGFTWTIEYHRETESPTGHPYGLSNLIAPTLPPGPLPACKPTTRAVDPLNSNHLIRFQQGLRIEESWGNELQTWQTLRDLPELRQESRYYFQRGGCWYCDYPVLSIGPHDLEFDPKTGNIVFAMGWDGVLIYTAQGQWHWVQAEQYWLSPLPAFDRAPDMLMFEYWLAGALGFLILTSLVSYLGRTTRFRVAMLVVGWLGWFILLLVVTPIDPRGIMPQIRENSEIAAVFSLLLLLLVALPMILLSLFDLIFYMRDRSIYLILLSMLGAASFLIPFYMWMQGAIPQYTTTKLVAIVISTVLIASIARLMTASSMAWTHRLYMWKGRGPIQYRALGYYTRSDGIIRAAPEQPQIHLQTTRPARPATHEPLIHPRRPGR